MYVNLLLQWNKFAMNRGAVFAWKKQMTCSFLAVCLEDTASHGNGYFIYFLCAHLVRVLCGRTTACYLLWPAAPPRHPPSLSGTWKVEKKVVSAMTADKLQRDPSSTAPRSWKDSSAESIPQTGTLLFMTYWIITLRVYAVYACCCKRWS